MHVSTPLYDLSPVLGLLLLAAAIALAPLAWVHWRHRNEGARAWLHALTLTTLFLTFDLVLFGAFTRLTDSGLGCPDWPGCYGTTNPLSAHAEIHSAQAALPSGPVTHGKAWIEMLHRYLAGGVGALIVLLLAAHLVQRRRGEHHGVSLLWPIATFVWVCVQGAFGAFTVTMKLYPAIVTAHLLGALVLLVLLAAQSESYERRSLPLSPALRALAMLVAALAAVQIALGGWVSTNYAVLACTDFPSCQGSYWPTMDFASGFTLLRPLGTAADGSWLPFPALTAIHYTHRLMAYAVLAALLLLAWRLHATGSTHHRRWARALGAIALWQLTSGLSNVVLGWPLIGALAHTGGAAALTVVLTIVMARSRAAVVAADTSLTPANRGSLDLAA